MRNTLRQGLVMVLLAALISVSTVGLAWSQQRRTITASMAVRALQEAGIAMGPPRAMEANEWGDVPLVAREALTFSVGDLRGCYGCDDPMAYVLYLPDGDQFQRSWQMVTDHIRLSTEPDWAYQYDGLIVILPAGLSQSQAENYHRVLDQLMASGSWLAVPRLNILSKSATG